MLTFAASAAQAGIGMVSVTGAPNPSTAGQTVSLSATFQAAGCAASFTDQTNSVSLCTAAAGASPTVSCSYAFPTAGVRTVAASSPCGGSLSYSQTVNAAPVTVPTMTEWALWGLAGALMLGGGAMLARRSRGLSSANKA